MWNVCCIQDSKSAWLDFSYTLLFIICDNAFFYMFRNLRLQIFLNFLKNLLFH